MSKSGVVCSVIVRCFNEERHIGTLLRGIQQQTVADVEVIVVDSGSTDATLSIARGFPVKIVNIDPASFSFGRALNRGCAQARGEILVFASAHVYPVYRDWLAHLLAPLSDPRIALVYGKQRGDERTRFSEHRVFEHWFPDESTANQSHPFCNNANAAVRRDAWEQRPYDEELTGLEDIDWAQRAMAAGSRIAYQATAEVIHVHQESPARIFTRYQREAIALRKLSPEAHLRLRDVVGLIPTHIAGDCREAWRAGRLWSEIWGIAMFRGMQFAGSYAGFRRHAPVSAPLRQRFYYPQRPTPSRRPPGAVGRERVEYDFEPEHE